MVCPAHAGIYPCGNDVSSSSPGLPRSRGDLPFVFNRNDSENMSAPLTRGSTLFGSRPQIAP